MSDDPKGGRPAKTMGDRTGWGNGLPKLEVLLSRDELPVETASIKSACIISLS
jgi:hypothetical protein